MLEIKFVLILPFLSKMLVLLVGLLEAAVFHFLNKDLVVNIFLLPMAILPLPIIQKEHWSVSCERNLH